MVCPLLELHTLYTLAQDSLFNFKPSVRPVPLEVHIAGFPGKHYCPRMATMNKPTYRAILQHSPTKPVLVFVSSRRQVANSPLVVHFTSELSRHPLSPEQTRLTALDLISHCSSDEKEHQFLRHRAPAGYIARTVWCCTGCLRCCEVLNEVCYFVEVKRRVAWVVKIRCFGVVLSGLTTCEELQV